MYFKEFEIRWNDLDANKHLGNSSYVEFMSHARMSFLTDHGIGLDVMASFGLGPIVLYEHIYYFKEIRMDTMVRVSIEVDGMTNDTRFVRLLHNFYDDNGKHLAHAEMLFSFIDMKTRKLGRIPDVIRDHIMTFPKSSDFKILSVEDTRKYGKKPIDLA